MRYEVFMNKILLFILLIITTQALFSVPVWYANPMDYHDSGIYIVGIGEGRSYEEAMAIARAEMIKQISVNVNVDTEVIFQAIETERFAAYTEHINRNIQLSAEREILGMEVLRQERMNRRYYVMTGLNKQRLLRSIEIEMSDLWLRIQASFRNAERTISEGQLVLALGFYENAQNLLDRLYSEKIIYDSLSDIPANIQDLVSIDEVENRTSALINSMVFEVVSGDHQSARVGVALNEPVVFSASIPDARDRKIMLRNLPVLITSGDGTQIESGFTNENGEYTVYVAGNLNQGLRGRVIIQANLSRFPEMYHQMMRDIRGEAFFRPTALVPINVNLSVVDIEGNDVPSAFRQVSRLLSDKNVFHHDDASIIAKGTVSLRDSRLVSGAEGQLFFADVVIDIEFRERESGNIIGVLHGRGRGMHERSDAFAINNAYERISLDMNELNELIVKIEDIDV